MASAGGQQDPRLLPFRQSNAEELLPLQAPRLRETESPLIQRRQAAMGIPDASSQFVQAVSPQPQRPD